MKKLVLIALLFIPTIGFCDTQTFTASATWTCPAGVTSVQAECWGGGGGGGGDDRGDSGSGGGGAGGGAYAKKLTISVTAGVGYTVNVGSAGVGGLGTAGGNGTSGGPSWFNTTATVLAVGGDRGQGGINAGFHGNGGASSACIGDTKFSGGNGGDGSAFDAGGGAGSSGGTAGNGNNGTNAVSTTPGVGGSAPTGGGAGGNGNTDTGSPGSVPGGGGGGGGSISGFKDGGIGASGKVVLTWTASAGSSLTIQNGKVTIQAQ